MLKTAKEKLGVEGAEVERTAQGTWQHHVIQHPFYIKFHRTVGFRASSMSICNNKNFSSSYTFLTHSCNYPSFHHTACIRNINKTLRKEGRWSIYTYIRINVCIFIGLFATMFTAITGYYFASFVV